MIAALSAVVLLVVLWIVPAVFFLPWPPAVVGGLGAMIALMGIGAYADR